MRQNAKEGESNMKIIVASDAFSETVSATGAASILEEKSRQYFPGCEVMKVPLSNGDEGVLEALCASKPLQRRRVNVLNYRGELTETEYGVLEDQTMVLQTSSILYDSKWVDMPVRNRLMGSTSYGVGQLIRIGLDEGYRRFYIGAGNSLAFDGGSACIAALGARFYDTGGRQMEPSGNNLRKLARIDLSSLDERLKESEIVIMTTVNNPVVGEDGTAYVYAALAGGGPDELINLERGMRRYVEVLQELTEKELSNMAGLGAAGGLPTALYAACGGKVKSGFSMVLRLIDFENILTNANLVIVGQAALTPYTIYRTAVSGISLYCKARGIPVAVIAGRIEQDAEMIYGYGVTSMIAAVNTYMQEDQYEEDLPHLLSDAADNMFRMIGCGIQIQEKEKPAFTINFKRRI